MVALIFNSFECYTGATVPFKYLERIVLSQKEASTKRATELSQLFEASYEKVARYIFVRIGDQHEAEDLASEVFLRAFRSLDSYQERGLPMEAWVFKIAHNIVVDYLRKSSKRQTVPLDDVQIPDKTNVEEMADVDFQTDKLSEAMKSLPQSQQDVISLRFFAELSSVEAGNIMNKKPGAVREMQRVALNSLREVFLRDRQL